jgi:serine/threonine-protein kinase
MADAAHPAWQRIAAVLDRVLEAPLEERDRLLAELAGDDPAVLQEVGELLAAAEGGRGVLDYEAGGYFGTLIEEAWDREDGEHPSTPDLPDTLGAWRVASEIGRGGMGIVYRAERLGGEFEQTAALKLLKRGLDSEAIVERFRQERQILARLGHRAIARLIDGGVAPDGRPYLVMELAEGEPITVWCDRRRLPLEERLQLLRRVCDAVQYAHVNLVVHRDLKPSNIVVTEKGDLKLLDFGIAKLLSEEGRPEAATWTGLGLRPMTPEYAAPEQVSGEPVSAATDVYALGVILCELLTGRRPHEAAGAGRSQVEAAILGTDPPPPSVVVARAAEGDRTAANELARARATTPGTLRRRLAGDLDAIVLKALRREPERRYASAEALAEDLRRCLAQEPVTARPEDRAYRARKFVRRHRLGVAATAAVTLALAAGLAVATWQAGERAREARRAEAVKDFLIGLFREADPVQAVGEDLSVQELLDRGSQQVRMELSDEPALQGELLTVLAGIYAELGVTDRAGELAGEALGVHESLYGDGDRRAATNLRQQAALAAARGDLEAAEPLARRALATHRRELGDGHPEVAEDLDVLVIALVQGGRDAEALPLARESLAIRRSAFAGDHRLVGDSLNNLAVLLRRQGELEEAAEVYAETVELRRRLLGNQHPHYALTLHNFAGLEIVRGRYGAAAPLQDEALESLERLYGSDHPLTLAARNNQASILVALADFEAGEAAFRGVLEAWRRTLGDDHPNALMTTAGLAEVYRARGDLETAERLLREVERRWNEVLGEDHVDGARIRRTLGALLVERGRYQEAATLLGGALESLRAVHGDRHPEVAATFHQLGLLALERGDPGDLAAAESALADAWRQRRDLVGESHPDTIASRVAMGAVALEMGRLDEGEEILRGALEEARQAVPEPHPLTIAAALELGRTLTARGDPDAAAELLGNTLVAARRLWGSESWRAAKVAIALAAGLAERGEPELAGELARASHATLAGELGADHPLTRRAAELVASGTSPAPRAAPSSGGAGTGPARAPA